MGSRTALRPSAKAGHGPAYHLKSAGKTHVHMKLHVLVFFAPEVLGAGTTLDTPRCWHNLVQTLPVRISSDNS